MKTKLLKKCRKIVQLHERNGKLMVVKKGFNYFNYKILFYKNDDAIDEYRNQILSVAYDIFKLRPKKQLR